MLGMRKLCDKLPRSLEGLKPILIYPVVGLLVIGLFMCLINPIVGAINTALYSGLEAMGEGSKIILGIVLAGMMAVPRGVIAAGMNKPLSCQHEFDRKSLFFDLLQKLRLMLSRIIAAQHHEELT